MSATHRDAAQELLGAIGQQGCTSFQDALALIHSAQVHATLAQADAIDRLTAVLERMEFPALEVKKAGVGSSLAPSYRVSPTRRAS